LCFAAAQEFQTMLSGLMQNPSMIGAYMNDPRMQLVSEGTSSMRQQQQQQQQQQ
jgi:hypothetical protein